MQSPTHLMTEEGIPRSKNFGRRIRRYVLVMVVVAVIGGYGVNRYYTRSHLPVLQRLYLPQYESTVLQGCLTAKWDYYTLVAAPNEVTVFDEETPYTSDENIEAVLDEEGQAKLYKSGLPIFRLKRITDDKVPMWAVRTCTGAERYEWLQSEIYKGRTILNIWKPAIGIGVLIFLFGVALFVLTDSLINRIIRQEKRKLLADSFDRSKNDRFQEQISAGKDQCVQ